MQVKFIFPAGTVLLLIFFIVTPIEKLKSFFNVSTSAQIGSSVTINGNCNVTGVNSGSLDCSIKNDLPKYDVKFVGIVGGHDSSYRFKYIVRVVPPYYPHYMIVKAIGDKQVSLIVENAGYYPSISTKNGAVTISEPHDEYTFAVDVDNPTANPEWHNYLTIKFK